MADLNELNEALAWAGDGIDWNVPPPIQLRTLIGAARRYAAGTPLMWCETHESSRNYSLSVLCDQKLRSLHLDPSPVELDGDCSIVERWITDPPEAVADARRTEEEG